MRIVFMGTPKFAADIFQYLIEDKSVDVVGFQTAPDKIRGRGKKLVPSLVKELALKHNIPEIIPDDVDYICVAAYGKILDEDFVNKYKCLNVHGSLLPRWRGAAPVERAILEGDEYTGVSIMKMDAGMDTGAYCAQEKIKIDDKSTDELLSEMAKLGAKLLVDAMTKDVVYTEQDENLVTYAKKIEKHELDLDDLLLSSIRKIQASSKAHPSKCIIANKSVTILKAKKSDITIKPNQVLFIDKKLYLGFNDGAMQITTLKPDGKNTMEAKAFAAGIQNIRDGGLTWEKV
ncbi:MAG: methionyl-tRNA formyltransferase [Coriobacteriia bacterium]|nr:methionyl-tRNA formyltransferase [Coriobacteriia bacterium]